MAERPGQPGMTAGELAKRLEGTLEGDGALVVRGVAPLDAAGPDSLSWVGDARFLEQAAESGAGVILMPLEGQAPPNKTIIRVADPDVALCEVLTLLSPPPAQVMPGVHPSATIEREATVEGACIGANVYVGANATVGPGTQLHPGVYIGADTKIGRDCVFWPNVVVRERITIGNRVILHPNATIGADGFGYLQREGENVKIPQVGSVVIEDDVEIGASSSVDRARSGVTRVGRGAKIDNLVIVGHNADVGEQCIIVALCGIGGSARLGRHVILGGHAGVSDHCALGDGVQMAAQTVAFKDYPAGAVLRGVPATDNQTFLREHVALRKLPALLKQIRDMEARIKELESRST